MRRYVVVPQSAISQKGISRPASIKKRRRRGFRFTKPKKTAKQPGFDAFTTKQVIEDDEGNMIDSTEVVAPESGIHSLAWTLAIVKQPGTFLALPYEIRQKIYTFVLLTNSRPQPVIRPLKNGKKFASAANPIILPIYNTLSFISRQTYVDVVGGGTVYAISIFAFNSTTLMTNYLSCINPAHKALIRSLELRVRITAHQSNIPKKVFTALASLTALQYLEIELSIDSKVYGRANYVEHIQQNKHWELLKDLRRFSLSFTGWNARARHYQFHRLTRDERHDIAQEIVRQKVLRS